MIEWKVASKRYGSLAVVENVSFCVKAGEYFALLGPSGAGKTTIIEMLLGSIQPPTGSLSVNSLPSTHLASRAAVGYLAENCR